MQIKITGWNVTRRANYIPPRDSRGVRLSTATLLCLWGWESRCRGWKGDQGPEQGHLLCGDQGLWGEMKVAIDCIALRRSTPLKISSQLISCWKKKKNQSCVKDWDVVSGGGGVRGPRQSKKKPALELLTMTLQDVYHHRAFKKENHWGKKNS